MSLTRSDTFLSVLWCLSVLLLFPLTFHDEMKKNDGELSLKDVTGRDSYPSAFTSYCNHFPSLLSSILLPVLCLTCCDHIFLFSSFISYLFFPLFSTYTLSYLLSTPTSIHTPVCLIHSSPLKHLSDFCLK